MLSLWMIMLAMVAAAAVVTAAYLWLDVWKMQRASRERVRDAAEWAEFMRVRRR